MKEHKTQRSIEQAFPLPMGAYETQTGIRFSLAVPDRTRNMVLQIFVRNTDELLYEVIMNAFAAGGDVCAVHIRGLQADEIYYRYILDGQVCTDPYGMRLYRAGSYGILRSKEERAAYEPMTVRPWKEENRPHLSFSEMILYKLHVRAFTMHDSSGVVHKGTFAGVTEKISYLKKLGVNTLVLMPAVDFAEVKEKRAATDWSSVIGTQMLLSGQETKPELIRNCWGYGQAQFFAPKASYAAGDAPAEFVQMVQKLHANGMEVLMELLFPDSMEETQILDCLRFWAVVYHVDGFWLNREVVPVEIAARDPLLRGLKLISTGFDTAKIYGSALPGEPTLGTADDGFSQTMRRFLKGDANVLGEFVTHMTMIPSGQARVHYITSNNGFTLADLVSYNEKHNEDNGEDNRDGTDMNLSWNCGAEGPTRSRRILQMRRTQCFNAVIFLLFAQGVPMLYAGDEFGNSQNGNNNAYCQDNETFWLNWRDQKKNRYMVDFVRQSIELRQAHPILHPSRAFAGHDLLGCGVPDLSLHGVTPWKLSYEKEERFAGIMYCGKYASVDGHADATFYFAFNMHWEEKTFVLPVLPFGNGFRRIADTALRDPYACESGETDTEYKISPRSIQIFVSEADADAEMSDR